MKDLSNSNKLEQLPPGKKRTLRPGQSGDQEVSFPPEAAKPAAPQPPAPPQQVAPPPVHQPVTPPVSAKPSVPPPAQSSPPVQDRAATHQAILHKSGEQTAKLERPIATTQHEVVKAPAPQPPPPAPPPISVAPPQDPLPPPVNAVYTQATEAVSINDKPFVVQKGIGADNDVQLFGALTGLDSPPEPSSPVRTVALYAVPVLILLAVAVGLVLYVPGLRERMPAPIAKMMGYTDTKSPQLSIQAYQIIYDEKEKTATVGGEVTNLSQSPISGLQVEFLLSKREDYRQAEPKIVAIDPAELAPGQKGKYQFVISTKDYQESKFSRVLSGETALRVKKLGVQEPPPIDPSQSPTSQANAGAPNPKPADNNQVYDGTVTFK